MRNFLLFFSKIKLFLTHRVLPVVKEGVTFVVRYVESIIGFISAHPDQMWLIIKAIGGLILLAISWQLFLLLVIAQLVFKRGTPNDVCPKCDSRNLKIVKASTWDHLMQKNVAIWVPGAKISKPLNVCRDCGFSWEDS